MSSGKVALENQITIVNVRRDRTSKKLAGKAEQFPQTQGQPAILVLESTLRADMKPQPTKYDNVID